MNIEKPNDKPSLHDTSLSECPFCGNVPSLLFRSTWYSDIPRPVISCPGPCAMKEVTTGTYMKVDECIAAWNNRANSAISKTDSKEEG